jgi:hypothetical protein
MVHNAAKATICSHCNRSTSKNQQLQAVANMRCHNPHRLVHYTATAGTCVSQRMPEVAELLAVHPSSKHCMHTQVCHQHLAKPTLPLLLRPSTNPHPKPMADHTCKLSCTAATIATKAHTTPTFGCMVANHLAASSCQPPCSQQQKLRKAQG